MEDLVPFIILNVIIQAFAFVHVRTLKEVLPRLPWWAIHISYFVIFSCLYSIDMQYGIYFMGVVLVSTFVLVVFLGAYQKVEKQAKNKQKKGDELKWKWARVLFFGSVSLLFVGAFFLSGPYFFLVIFLCIPTFYLYQHIFVKGGRVGFYRLQQRLPTSKVRSMAMGLVEVEGEVQEIELVTTPLDKKKECIGYLYTIEDESTDDDGRRSYHMSNKESECCSFTLTDDTGSIEIDARKIRFKDFPIDKQHVRTGRRHTQYLLEAGMEVLLIGKASERGGQPIVEYDEYYRMLALAPTSSVNRWNKLRPMFQSMKLYGCVAAVLVALILMTTIQVDGNVVTIKW